MKRTAPPLPAEDTTYQVLVGEIGAVLEEARSTAARAVHSLLAAAYWEIGRRIVEFEQRGADRAAYGEGLLKRLALDLSARLGRGFSPENLRLMRLFYLRFRDRISQTPSGKLPDEPVVQISQTLSGIFPLPWSH